MKEVMFLYNGDGTQGGEPNPTATQVDTPQPTNGGDAKPQKVQAHKVLKELSKEFGVNLFAEDGLTKLREKRTTEREQYKAKDTEISTHKTKLAEYEQKASRLEFEKTAIITGVRHDALDDVFTLAEKNKPEGKTLTEGLEVVKSKYPQFFQEGGGAGLTMRGNLGSKDLPLNEKERYLANNPKYQAWQKKQGKK